MLSGVSVERGIAAPRMLRRHGDLLSAVVVRRRGRDGWKTGGSWSGGGEVGPLLRALSERMSRQKRTWWDYGNTPVLTELDLRTGTRETHHRYGQVPGVSGRWLMSVNCDLGRVAGTGSKM